MGRKHTWLSVNPLCQSVKHCLKQSMQGMPGVSWLLYRENKSCVGKPY